MPWHIMLFATLLPLAIAESEQEGTNEMKTNKRRALGILSLVVVISLFVGVWAYYNSTGTIDNQLSTKTYGDQMVEKFTPVDDWKPGQAVDKNVTVQNTGGSALLVRITMSETWSRGGTAFKTNAANNTTFITGAGQANSTDGLTTADSSVVAKTINTTNWTYSGGYWYYNVVLTAGNTTPAFLTQITLAAAADMGLSLSGNYYTTKATAPADSAIGSNPATSWVSYTGAVPAGTTYTRAVNGVDLAKAGYAGATYDLFVTYETYEATTAGRAAAVTAGWSSTATPAV